MGRWRLLGELLFGGLEGSGIPSLSRTEQALSIGNAGAGAFFDFAGAALTLVSTEFQAEGIDLFLQINGFNLFLCLSSLLVLVGSFSPVHYLRRVVPLEHR